MSVERCWPEPGRVVRTLAELGLILLALVAAPGRALALGPGAPPEITRLAAYQEGQRAVFSVKVDVPGGRVPQDIAFVGLVTPTNGLVNLGLERRDLLPDASFTASVGTFPIGAPPGPYRVIVQDLAGGVTEVAFQITQWAVPLPAATKLHVNGSTVSIPTGARVVNLAAFPNPTIGFRAVPEAALHRVIIREANSDADALALDVPGTGGLEDDREVTVPGGVLVPNRRYVVVVQAYDVVTGDACTTACPLAAFGTRSQASLEFITQGPEVELATLGGTADGETLTVSVRAFNRGAPANVIVFAWLGLSNGQIVQPAILFPGFFIPTSSTGDFFNGPVLSHTFQSGDPTGPLVLGVRLVDSTTGYTVAIATRTLTR